MPLLWDIWVHNSSKCPNTLNAQMPLNWQDSWFERDQFGCKIWMQRFLFIHAHDLGALNHCPNAVNTIKEVWLLTEMVSGPLRPWLFQIINIGMLTFLFDFTKWQICWTPMQMWRFQKIESHAILLHIAFNKKLMQIETYLLTKLMVLIITCDA